MPEDYRREGLGASSPSAPTGPLPSVEPVPVSLASRLRSHGATTDAGTALLAAVRASVSPFPGFVLEKLTTRSWASVTFRGGRHDLTFRLGGDGAETAASRFLASLDTLGGPLRGHLLCDVSLVSEERRPGFARIQIEALTVEDA